MAETTEDGNVPAEPVPASEETGPASEAEEVQDGDPLDDLFGDDKDDLFGDDTMPADATMSPTQVAGDFAKVEGSQGSIPPEKEFDAADLFGEDEASEPGESGDEGPGPQPGIADLFEDDEDDEEQGPGGQPVKKDFVKEERVQEPSRVVKQEVGEDDDEEKVFGSKEEDEAANREIDPEDEERDLFGELSDDQSEIGREVEDHSVRKRLLPDGEVFVFKIPNTLAMEMEPYNPDNLESSLGFKERMNEYDRPAMELCGPENTIRWRFKADERGNKETDDNGDAVFESNAQFVEFEDGSILLQVGDEYFECQNRDETRSHLYVEEENDLFVFHKPLTKHMQVVPSGFTTKTHERLLNSQINKIRAMRTVKPLSHLQAEKKNREQEMEAEHARQDQAKKSVPKKRPVMDADYLEGEDGAEGPSLKTLKKNPGLGGFLQHAADILR